MPLDEQKIKYFLKDNFDINVEKIEKIKRGVMNANYKIRGDGGQKYIFRVYNYKNKEQVGFEAEVLEYLKDKDIPSPLLVPAVNNDLVFVFNNKPGVVYKYIEGESASKITPELLRQVGEIKGRMHKILKDFKPTIDKPTWDPEELKLLVSDNKEKMIAGGFPGVEDLINFVQSEIKKYEFPDDLPTGVTHQDLKPENILVKGGQVSGIVDFDNSYVGVLLHDITTTIIWTCFNSKELDPGLLKVFLNGYNREREITELEKNYLLDAIKFRLIREVFIGSFVTPRYPELSKERADYFIGLYNSIKNNKDIAIA